jgi:hypothetical protein
MACTFAIGLLLTTPIPHGQHVIWATPNCCKSVPRLVEADVTVYAFGATLTNLHLGQGCELGLGLGLGFGLVTDSTRTVAAPTDLRIAR